MKMIEMEFAKEACRVLASKGMQAAWYQAVPGWSFVGMAQYAAEKMKHEDRIDFMEQRLVKVVFQNVDTI